MAHEGAVAFRDKYELVHRHRARQPNATWQADHIQLNILGFAPHYRPLHHQELKFALTRRWQALNDADFADAQAVAAIDR